MSAASAEQPLPHVKCRVGNHLFCPDGQCSCWCHTQPGSKTMNDELRAKIDAFVAERPEHTIVIDHNEMVEGLLAIAVQYAEEREAKVRIVAGTATDTQEHEADSYDTHLEAYGHSFEQRKNREYPECAHCGRPA